jgi:hypothetical protein
VVDQRQGVDGPVVKLLDPAIRVSQSLRALVDHDIEERIATRLAADLSSSAWDTRHGHLREQHEFDGSLRLVISARA